MNTITIIIITLIITIIHRQEIRAHLGSADSSDWTRRSDYCRWWRTSWRTWSVPRPRTGSGHKGQRLIATASHCDIADLDTYNLPASAHTPSSSATSSIQPCSCKCGPPYRRPYYRMASFVRPSVCRIRARAHKSKKKARRHFKLWTKYPIFAQYYRIKLILLFSGQLKFRIRDVLSSVAMLTIALTL